MSFVVKPVCRICGCNLPKGAAFGDIHKRCAPADPRTEPAPITDPATLLRQQKHHGICSTREPVLCSQPIYGWCATCYEQGATYAPRMCAGCCAQHTRATGHSTFTPYP